MDDVGQTLLNWASAFGTTEMVEFLCERGADVNKGQRSSSLHYAACFGRPQVNEWCVCVCVRALVWSMSTKVIFIVLRRLLLEGHR